MNFATRKWNGFWCTLIFFTIWAISRFKIMWTWCLLKDLPQLLNCIWSSRSHRCWAKEFKNMSPTTWILYWLTFKIIIWGYAYKRFDFDLIRYDIHLTRNKGYHVFTNSIQNTIFFKLFQQWFCYSSSCLVEPKFYKRVYFNSFAKRWSDTIKGLTN